MHNEADRAAKGGGGLEGKILPKFCCSPRREEKRMKVLEEGKERGEGEIKLGLMIMSSQP